MTYVSGSDIQPDSIRLKRVNNILHAGNCHDNVDINHYQDTFFSTYFKANIKVVLANLKETFLFTSSN